MKLLAVTLFWLVVGIGRAASGALTVPHGIDGGPVRFDARITEYSTLGRTEAVIYVRYWVSKSWYRAGVIWAEPYGRDLAFSQQPSSLVFGGSSNSFSIAHELLPKLTAEYRDLEERRPPFRYMFGDYTVSNLRFAAGDAARYRLALGDFPSTFGTNKTWELVGKSQRSNVNRVEVNCSGNAVEGLEIYENGAGAKTIHYDYNKTDGIITEIDATLPEKKITATLPGKGLQISARGKTNSIQEFPLFEHKGGRFCVVRYDRIVFGDSTIPLPVRVEVRDSRKELLRTVEFLNYEKIGITDIEGRSAASRFADPSETEKECRRLREKYWTKAPNEIEEADIPTIQALYEALSCPLPPHNIAAQSMRRLTLRLDLGRLMGNRAWLTNDFSGYLSLLGDSGQEKMILPSGRSIVESFSSRQRFEEANLLLKIWVDASVKKNPHEAICAFSENEMKRGQLWSTRALLQADAASQKSPDLSFEAFALNCSALSGILDLLRSPRDPLGSILKTQARWIANSISEAGLEHLLQESIELTHDRFRQISSASDREKDYWGKVSEIQRRSALREPAN